ncbi:hypothetical protein FOZ60_004932 [Perkinsus olseni]|uniref:Peptidase A1 domain-containing protein n=1 Tax=Perkinsus olseni TaxID=32597 RepID=A0A7J6NS71_PEROL|nr:hypothetical protein FOZ60_004932 [Perkinsus olseni]
MKALWSIWRLRTRVTKPSSGIEDVSGPGFFDTGTNALVMPHSIANLVLDRLQANVTLSEESGLLKVSCADVAHLLPITFLMKGFGGELPLLEIPATSYVYKETEAVRILAITFSDKWILALPALIGHFFLYDWENSRIGFADLK